MAASAHFGADSEDKNLFRFKDGVTVADPFFEYSDFLQGSRMPLIIDNGSYKCRVGWASDNQPRIIFKNVIAKQRGKKHEKQECETQIGNDISNIEVVRWQLKTHFDRNIVTQYDVQEQILDYIFNHLGVNTSGCVDHPIVLTEPVCNPNYCRQQMSELLFECYHVPKVAYGVDSLFSLYNNHPNPGKASGLVVGCGYQTTHVMPVLNGHLQSQFSRRINVGGLNVDGFMHRLLQLKYPGHFTAITLSRAEELVRDSCYMGVDYMTELSQWAAEDFYFKNVHKIQLPHSPMASSIVSAEQQKERREQQIRRLKDLNAKRREEKLAEDQETLQTLLAVQELQDDDEEEPFNRALQEHAFASPIELNIAINKLNNGINKLNNKILAEETEVPDSQPKSKKTKEDKKTLGLLQQVGELRERDLESFLENINTQRQSLLEQRTARRQKRTDMAKRRTLASQQRMKIITELAQGKRSKKEDTFGQNDDDWNVYKQINKDGGDSDSEAEQEKLDEFEAILKEYDPNFRDGNAVQQPVTPEDIAEYYRLHIGIERIRVPETLLQPSMIGMEQAGIAETIDFVLKKFSAEEQNKLVQYVFLTGGCATFPNFKQRLERELLALLPFQSNFKVYTAVNPALDAWYGARRWALSPALNQYSVTKAEYEEKGGEYLKEHMTSNRYFPTPFVEQKVVPMSLLAPAPAQVFAQVEPPTTVSQDIT